MGLNTKNEETCRLAGELAHLTEENKTSGDHGRATRTPRTYIIRDNAVELYGLGG